MDANGHVFSEIEREPTQEERERLEEALREGTDNAAEQLAALQAEEAAGQEPLDLSPREEFINKVLGDLARDELGQRTVGDAIIAAFGEGVTEEFIGGLADMLLEYQAQCIVTGSDARSSTLQIFMRGMELGRGLVEASAS